MALYGRALCEAPGFFAEKSVLWPVLAVGDRARPGRVGLVFPRGRRPEFSSVAQPAAQPASTDFGFNANP